MTDTDSRTTVIDTDTTASPPSAGRTFPPSPEFAANANLTADAYQRAAADPEAFWAEQASRLTWVTRSRRCWTGPRPPMPGGSLTAP